MPFGAIVARRTTQHSELPFCVGLAVFDPRQIVEWVSNNGNKPWQDVSTPRWLLSDGSGERRDRQAKGRSGQRR